MVECQLPKLNVAGSSPVTRFKFLTVKRLRSSVRALSRRLAGRQSEPGHHWWCQGVVSTFSQSFSHYRAIDWSGIQPSRLNSCSVQQWIVLDHGLAEDANWVLPNMMWSG